MEGWRVDSSSYRSQFIQSHNESSNNSENSIKAFNSFWSRIARCERELGKRLEDGYSKEDYIKLIAKLHVSSSRVLSPVKSRIGQYLKWLNERGALEKDALDTFYSITYSDIDPGDIFENKYYKDFGSLKDEIDHILHAAAKTDESVFATQISALYMAWCGLTIEETLNLKKSDVGEDSIRVGDKVINPTGVIMDYIKEYRDADGYLSQARGLIKLKYASTQWLFRTVRAAHIDVRTMRILINKFSTSAAGAQESDLALSPLSYYKVYWSGIFSRAYVYECINGPIKSGDKDKIELVFNEKYSTITLANARLNEYQRFKQHFFPVPLRILSKDET